MTNLVVRRFILNLILIIAVISVSTNTYAQSYVSLARGSKYICGSMPNGTRQIFLASSRSSSPISMRKAIANVQRDIKTFHARVQKLNRLISSLKDGGLSSAEINNYNNIKKLTDPKGRTLGKKSFGKERAIRGLVSKLKNQIRIKGREITALKKCNNNNNNNNNFIYSTNASLTFDQVKFQGLDGLYLATMMYLPAVYDATGKPLSSLWYCIRGPWQTEGMPRLFSSNPCVSGRPSVSRNDCSQFTPTKMYTEIYTYRLFLGPTWDLNNLHVEAAVMELQQFYSGRIFGRPRTSLKDDCKIVP